MTLDRNALDVVRVLRGPDTHRIRFRFIGLTGPITVDRSSFERVATAIENNLVRVAEGNDSNLDHGIAGAYDGRHAVNIFLVRRTGHYSRLWQSTVVHEAVHASFDLTHSRVSDADNEAAAFLASAMYLVMNGLPIRRYRHDAQWESYVRSTAMTALRTGRVDNDAMVYLRETLISANYNHGDLGTIDNPAISTGNG